MRIVTNEALIQRNKTIAQVLFFASLAFLVGSFLLSNQLADSQWGLYFQCVMIPALFILVIVSVRMTNAWVRQPHPWEKIPEALKGIGDNTMLYNFMLPANHVLINNNGIFSITTRFQDRPQKVVDDKWQSGGGILALIRQDQIGNPTQDARLAAARTEAYLRELLHDETIQVQPLILFTHPGAIIVREGEQTIPVLTAKDDKKEAYTLKNYLREAKKQDFPTLTPQQIAILDDALLYED